MNKLITSKIVRKTEHKFLLKMLMPCKFRTVVFMKRESHVKQSIKTDEAGVIMCTIIQRKIIDGDMLENVLYYIS